MMGVEITKNNLLNNNKYELCIVIIGSNSQGIDIKNFQIMTRKNKQ